MERFFDPPEVTLPLPIAPVSFKSLHTAPFRHFQLWVLQVGSSPQICYFSESNSG